MSISEKDLFDARTAWGNGLIEISETFENEGIEMATSIASDMIDNLYGFNFGQVLFKPTLSGGSQTFRPTKEGALSYFVGHNPAYPNDSGFGIKFWREINSDTAAIFIDDTVAMWMGWVNFIDRDGQVTKVDKSWGYKLDDVGNLRIMLHHSSLPYGL
tara:strand:- start:5 stop:478 length:474 start_codon:yes stop_codon:yes gene_type:complete